MTRKLLRAGTLIVAGLAFTGGVLEPVNIAHAQDSDEQNKVKALAAYKQGTTQYNLGNWERAISHFKTAFETYPDAAFLFNIAQSYRQANDCRQSAFFYKRYLAIKPKAANRVEVEGFIRDLEQACRNQQANSDKPPTGPMNPDGKETTGTTGTNTNSDTGTNVSTDTGTTSSGTEVADASTDSTDGSISSGVGAGSGSGLTDSVEPSMLVAYAGLGANILSVGDLDVGTRFGLTVGGGIPIKLGNITLDGGALVSYTPIPWESDAGKSGTASLIAVLANVGASMEVANKIRVRGELGVGALVFTGLSAVGNVFLDRGFVADAPISMFNVRVSANVEYALTDAIAVTATTAISVAPAHEDLRDDIDRIVSFQALLGVGYKM